MHQVIYKYIKMLALKSSTLYWNTFVMTRVESRLPHTSPLVRKRTKPVGLEFKRLPVDSATKAVTTTAEIAGKYTTFHKRGDHRIEWNAACGTRAEQDVLHMALQPRCTSKRR